MRNQRFVWTVRRCGRVEEGGQVQVQGTAGREDAVPSMTDRPEYLCFGKSARRRA